MFNIALSLPVVWRMVAYLFTDGSTEMKMIRSFHTGSVVLVALAATACASAPPVPEASLQAARQAIATAEAVDAGRSAPVEYGEARTKLSEADAAVVAGRMDSAERLALESRASADLAAAKTASLKALTVNADMKAANQVLREELNRNVGESK
jgi:nitric oxide reductase large subunit